MAIVVGKTLSSTVYRPPPKRRAPLHSQITRDVWPGRFKDGVHIKGVNRETNEVIN